MALPDLTGQNIQDTYQRVLQTDNGTLRDGTGSLVTLTDITASGDISASGNVIVDNVLVNTKIIHNEDSNTSIDFSGDQVIFTVGGETLITLTESTQDIVTIGDGGDVDFKVRTLGDDETIFVQGSSDNVGIGTDSPTEKLTVEGNISASGTGSFGRVICTSISASTGEFDADTIFIGGTSFNKAELDTLKEGKTINTTAKDLKEGDTNKTNIIRPDAIMHPNDNSTYSKYTTTGRIGTFISGTLFHDLNLNGNNNYVVIGDGNTDIQLKGNINEATIDGGTF